MSTPALYIHTDTGGLYVRVVQQSVPQRDHDAPDNVNGGSTPDKVSSRPQRKVILRNTSPLLLLFLVLSFKIFKIPPSYLVSLREVLEDPGQDV
jgi:hypothetical protein